MKPLPTPMPSGGMPLVRTGMLDKIMDACTIGMIISYGIISAAFIYIMATI